MLCFFSLNVKSVETILVFSFVGYEPQEVVIGELTEINFVLKMKTQSLDEMVVLGYGVQKKKLVTGVTLQVKGDDITKLNASNAIQAIQWQTAGVNITFPGITSRHVCQLIFFRNYSKCLLYTIKI